MSLDQLVALNMWKSFFNWGIHTGGHFSLTPTRLTEDPGQTDEEHDTPDVQHASHLWARGVRKTLSGLPHSSCICTLKKICARQFLNEKLWKSENCAKQHVGLFIGFSASNRFSFCKLFFKRLALKELIGWASFQRPRASFKVVLYSQKASIKWREPAMTQHNSPGRLLSSQTLLLLAPSQ